MKKINKKKDAETKRLALIVIIVIITFALSSSVNVYCGVVASILVVFLYIFYNGLQKKKKVAFDESEKENRINYLTGKFGSEIALKIIDKEVEIGMTKEMVDAAWEIPTSKKEITKVNYKLIAAEYYPKTKNGQTQCTKYAVFRDNKLIEFGEI